MKTYYNPTLAESEKYPLETTIFSQVKGVAKFRGKTPVDLNDLKFSEVDDLKVYLKNLNDENIKTIFKMIYNFDIDFKKIRCLEFYKAFNYIAAEVLEIYKKESVLGGEPSPKMKAAGIEKMAIFDTLNITDDIGQRYKVDPEIVESWKYGKVYIIALKMNYESSIRKNLSEMKD